MTTLRDLTDRLGRAIRGHRGVFVATVVTASVVMWLSVAAAAWFLGIVLTGLPGEKALHNIGMMERSTALLDVHDRTAFTFFREQRIEVPLSRVSRHLVAAILAIEDRRFYDHLGVDLVRIAGAALSNVRAARIAEGGSTITQQLVRHAFLSHERSWRRKAKEALLAVRVEREFSKDRILEFYLNKVYFGRGFYGVEAASLGFFGKHASDLDVAEAALLAGLLKAPSTSAPTINPERALARRNVVLSAMRDSGAIDDATYGAAVRVPIQLRNALPRGGEEYGQYFKEEVRQELVKRFGEERIAQGGLRVFTTLDMDMQKAAEAEVSRALDEIDDRRAASARKTPGGTPSEPLQGALVAVDPRSGEIRAMVGGRDFAEQRFNRAVQARRQAGSAFKPFVYAAALERGYTPASLITRLDEPIATLNGTWAPEDRHQSGGGAMTMRTALRTSSNRAAVRMLEEVGIDAAADYAERLGVGDVPSVPSLALGSGEVTLLSMTAAFGAFANQGLLFAPTLIRRVETIDGHVLYQAKQQPQRVVSEPTAFMMTSMMADVIDAGTASQARKVGFTLPAAGKTGTTNDYHDAWFIGYTPRLVTGVWIGYDQPRTIVARGYAAILAVPLWARFMKVATTGDDPEEFPMPSSLSGVDICRVSGKRAGDRCREVSSVTSDGTVTQRSMVYTEFFVHGTEPVEICRAHDGTALFDSFVVGTSGADALPAVASETWLPDLPPDETIPLPPPPEPPPAPVPDVPVQTMPPPPDVPADPAPPVEDVPRPPPPG